MTNETTHRRHVPKERKDFAFGISPGEWATAVAMGIAGGILTATKAVRDRFMHDLKKSVKYEAEFKEHAKALSEMRYENYAHLGDQAATTFRTALNKLKKEHRGDVAAWAKSYRGVDDTLIKGTIQRFNVQSRSSRASIIFNGIVGAAVGAGMTLSFFNGVATRDKIENINDATTELKNLLPPSEPAEAQSATALDRSALPETQITKVAKHERLAANDTTMALKA